MAAFKDLETKLNDLFGKKAPVLPRGGKEFIVKAAPVVALVLGILTVLSIVSMWRWAHVVHTYSNFASEVCNATGVSGCDAASASRLTFWLWLTLVVSLAEAILYIAAFSGLQARKKRGWDCLYWAALVNILYAAIVLFTDYGGVSSFFWNLLFAALGLWVLFQIRPYYTGEKTMLEPRERPRQRPSKSASPKPPEK